MLMPRVAAAHTEELGTTIPDRDPMNTSLHGGAFVEPAAPSRVAQHVPALRVVECRARAPG